MDKRLQKELDARYLRWWEVILIVFFYDVLQFILDLVLPF